MTMTARKTILKRLSEWGRGFGLLIPFGFFLFIQSFPAFAQDMDIRSETETLSTARPTWLGITVNLPEGAHVPLIEALGYAAMTVEAEEGTLNTGAFQFALSDEAVWQRRFENSFRLLVPVSIQETARRVIGIRVALKTPLCAEGGCTDQTFQGTINMVMGTGLIDQSLASWFQETRKRVPNPMIWPASSVIESETVQLRIAMEGETRDILKNARFYATQPDLVAPGTAMTAVETDYGLVFEGPRSAKAPVVDSLTGIMVTDVSGALVVYRVKASNIAEEAPVLIAPNAPVEAEITSLWLALGFALVGGLILNLMPCVFPVLTLKFVGFLKAGSTSATALRHEGWVYTAGVLVGFLAIAGVLILLRQAGLAVGWGFQLQSPAFVSVLVAVLFLAGLAFLGLWKLPFFAVESSAGRSGPFLTGLLATFVATPCTAPFMAPAIAFALGSGVLVALGIFVGLGLGMALPFLVLSHAPGLARRLPKPGPWMVRLQRWMALPVFLTIGWLLWVLWLQTGWNGLVLPLGLMTAAVLGFLYFRLFAGEARFVQHLLAGFLVLAMLGAGLGLEGRQYTFVTTAETKGGVTFTPEALQDLRRQGRPVFLNVTAAWCITCIVQERLVLSTGEFRTLLADNDIVYMVADWTNPDPRIERLLRQFGREGIPFYLYYPPRPDSTPVVLPEVLTIKAVQRAINKGD